MGDCWYTSDNYFDPDTFDFDGHDVTVANLKAALIIRKIKSSNPKNRGPQKKSLLVV